MIYRTVGKFGKLTLFEHLKFGELINQLIGYQMVLVRQITDDSLNLPNFPAI